MKKFDRSHYGPGWAEIILGAVLSAVIGVVLAAAYFVFKPVVRVKEIPKEPAADTVYYIEGSRDYANARRLTAKEKFFIRGGTVVVNEDELNTAANPVAAPVTPGSEPTPPQAALLTPGTPNFHIQNGVMQITVPVRVKWDLAFLDQTVLVQARGGFARQGDTIAFVPKTVYVGSCPVERLPQAVDFVMKKFFDTQPIPPDIAAAWRKLADVTIEGSTLRLTMP